MILTVEDGWREEKVERSSGRALTDETQQCIRTTKSVLPQPISQVTPVIIDAPQARRGVILRRRNGMGSRRVCVEAEFVQ